MTLVELLVAGAAGKYLLKKDKKENKVEPITKPTFDIRKYRR